ncbi:sialate O-acetylesterase [Phenylobacterium deserti]|uniref:sialate O-acetylesterase n=1 Tax=Phenylobacterium deserti TaxID=1914756 RepID=UPI0014024A84|nr:sialate O-acetylesterase [Phenylobacterium deserti]
MGWRRILGPAAAALLVAAAGGASAQSLLHTMFQDHAVLQRERPVPVWGQAQPGEQVTVEFAGKSASATADAQGRWRAELPATPAGGPFVLRARAGGRTQSVSDVLVGDVWLCSGQSNMQMRVKFVSNAENELREANHPNIRLFQVDQYASSKPLTDFAPDKARPSWNAVTPQTIGEFSAACYFFARELQKTVNVPQGLVHASWGGSTIQTWLTEPTLRQLGYGAAVDALQQYRTDPAGAGRTWGKAFEGWWRKNYPTAGTPWLASDNAGWKTAPEGFGAWETWGDPDLVGFDGLAWLRTTVDLTAAQARQRASLELGAVADADITWINGVPIGSDRMWGPERRYQIPKGVLKAGRNTITMGVFNAWNNGGLLSSRDKQLLRVANQPVPLNGAWSYKIGAKGNSAVPFPPWDALFGIAVARNGMIEPIGPYAARGLLWYQGESNTARPLEYGPMLQGLMRDFRATQGRDIDVLVVQLAAFGSRASQPMNNGWTIVREQQRRVVAADPHAGLVITTDIGDPTDVHPTQKPELGRRLARAARHVSYGEAISPSGPVAARAEGGGGVVQVKFSDVTGKLLTYSSNIAIGFELCGGEAAGSCAFVEGRVISPNIVRLNVPHMPQPKLVRFCWADSPICNLYDESGLPAGPFEIPVQ